MRPTSDELIVGMRNVLEDVLIPELQSDWAQAMGTQMALMLQHLEGRETREPDFLAGENAKLEGVLAKANDALGGEAVAVPKRPADEGLEGLGEHNEALREAITSAIHAAYGQGEYGFNDLPADRLGITDDLMEIATRQAEFWQPIGFTYPGRQRR
ncbi:MAG: hypothetical protein F4X89_07675 [Dehalococcoidia bacterium]|nr:hypothetical protein [Dehalococcoidia bacterium]